MLSPAPEVHLVSSTFRSDVPTKYRYLDITRREPDSTAFLKNLTSTPKNNSSNHVGVHEFMEANCMIPKDVHAIDPNVENDLCDLKLISPIHRSNAGKISIIDPVSSTHKGENS